MRRDGNALTRSQAEVLSGEDRAWIAQGVEVIEIEVIQESLVDDDVHIPGQRDVEVVGQGERKVEPRRGRRDKRHLLIVEGEALHLSTGGFSVQRELTGRVGIESVGFEFDVVTA